jgi:succinate dehydrogenase/fumarate reductase flavoprotein subunit
MTRNLQFMLLCEAARSTATMMGTLAGQEALAKVEASCDFARSNSLEADLEAMSERKLEALASTIAADPVQELRRRLESYRAICTKSPKEYDRLIGRIDAIRAKLKLLHMQSKGQQFKQQVSRVVQIAVSIRQCFVFLA